MGYGNDVLSELRKPATELRQAIPGAYDGFIALSKGAMADGALDAKTKELIALAIAVSTRCDGCIASHARNAARHGATPEEVADAIAVTFLMTGGPGTVYGPRAYAAFMEYYERYSKDSD
ncbi:MAG: alkylhydroperoxidase [Ilumatobacter coccineus]|uniref:Alkylhydroperoxidase n=1 Tax=Ilumatobacter coccineus TaxID=467094 RepID=A0A2G6K8I7_9ACTN|nr:MAG: alkylhydroperoxidase [Ilumatobacter coccineus]